MAASSPGSLIRENSQLRSLRLDLKPGPLDLDDLRGPEGAFAAVEDGDKFQVIVKQLETASRKLFLRCQAVCTA